MHFPWIFDLRNEGLAQTRPPHACEHEPQIHAVAASLWNVELATS
jgi:hypothetical protein